MNPHKRKARGNRPADPPAPRVRRSLPEWLSVQLDVPSDLLDGGIRLDMRGRNCLTVHGCTRILHFSPEAVCLELGNCALTVRGHRLICTSYLAGAVGVEGCICCMEFSDGEVTP